MSVETPTPTPATPVCPLGLTADTLSPYRDEALPAPEQERIRAHLETCPACRARLAEYDAIGRALRAQRVPVPDGRVWQHVRSAAGRRDVRRWPHISPTWRAMSAAAAVLVLVAGFAALFRDLKPTSHAPVRTGTLTWQKVTLPQGFTSNPTTSSIAVAPGDGDVAYACQGGPSKSLVWATGDRGAHWTLMSALPPEGRCMLTVDQLDPRIVMASVGPNVPTDVTTDGGKTWAPSGIPLDDTIQGLATWNGNTYALLAGPPGASATLAESKGLLGDWRSVDQGLAEAGAVLAFWMNPGNSGLLAEVGTPGKVNSHQLFTTRDAIHWSGHQAPAADAFVVQQPAAGQPWRFCAINVQGATPDGEVMCSPDGGASFVQAPAAPVSTQSTSSQGSVASSNALSGRGVPYFALAGDGSLLAFSWSPNTAALYRLPAGAGQWERLGTLPAGSGLPEYEPTADGGVLWAWPNSGTSGGDVYTASYTAGTHPAPAATGQPSAQPTATTPANTFLPPAPLSWQRGALPTSPGDFPAAVTPAPSNGNVAYACSGPQAASPATLHVWVTQDRGAHWMPMADISAQPPTGTTDHFLGYLCTLIVDDLNPQTLVAVETREWSGAGGGPSPQDLDYYVSFDGAASWRHLTASRLFELQGQIASLRGVVYALRSEDSSGAAGGWSPTGIWTSGDQMRTWTDISAGLTSQVPNGNLDRFWLDPSSGALLAELPAGTPTSKSGGGAPAQLWSSTDSGQHWSQLSTLTVGDAPLHFVVQQPMAGQPWHICGAGFATQDASGQPNVLTCTTDGGQSWQSRPGLNPPPAGQNAVDAADVFAIASDGSVLASSGQTLYRLAPGESRWQSLGDLPAQYPMLAYAPTSGGPGVIWESRSADTASYP